MTILERWPAGINDMTTKDHPHTPAIHRLRWLLLLAALILCLGWAFHANYRLTIVAGDSMNPTFRSGDILLVDRHAYDGRIPARGDIVTAVSQGELLVKRVVGLPGEAVKIDDGTLLIDGSPVLETYVRLNGHLFIGEGLLTGNRFGLIGDNRAFPHATMPVIASGKEIVGRVVASFSLLRLQTR
jgi:signal peptidase I